MSVTNFFAARGLGMLAQMLGAGGAANASAVAAAATALRAAIVREMWNGTAFCDGICAEVEGKALVVSQMFALAFGLVEPAAAADAWRAVSAGGLEGMGVYAAFFYFAALGQSYYSDAAAFDAPDDGTAIVTALFVGRAPPPRARPHPLNHHPPRAPLPPPPPLKPEQDKVRLLLLVLGAA
jgi:hypothetical protein